MDPLKIAKKSINMSFSMINLCSNLYFAVQYPKYKKILNKNRTLKNLHKGETCFIVGNGPSVNDLDTSLLVGQDILTVNGMVESPLFDQLSPKFYCLIDRNVFKKYSVQIKNKINENPYTTFILHRKLRNEVGDLNNVFYVYGTKLPVSKKLNIDLAANFNAYINIVPNCIAIAIYLGYKEIVLLGCDFNFFAVNKNLHFYENKKNVHRKESLFQSLFGASIACQQFEYLYQYAKEKDINIINATTGSLLDVFPQRDLEIILKEKKR